MGNHFQKGLMWNSVWFESQTITQLQQPPFLPTGKAEETLNQQVLDFLHQWYDGNQHIELQTSGSTGKPKIIRVEKHQMVQSALMTGKYFGLQSGNTALLCLSPEFIAGKMMIVRAIVLGLNLIIQPLDALITAQTPVTFDFAAMVPLQVARLLRENLAIFQHIRTLIIGGSSLSAPIETALQSVSTQCWHTYAMTETVSHVAVRPINGPNKTSWFTPLEGISIFLNPAGCLCIDAPSIAAETIETNDLAEMDQGKFKILGRTDDVVISAGYKINLAQTEQKLGTVISQPFFLTSENHDESGQILVLFVEDKPSANSLHELSQKIDSVLHSAEKPRKIIQMPHFEYLGSGKISKHGTRLKHASDTFRL